MIFLSKCIDIVLLTEKDRPWLDTLPAQRGIVMEMFQSNGRIYWRMDLSHVLFRNC